LSAGKLLIASYARFCISLMCIVLLHCYQVWPAYFWPSSTARDSQFSCCLHLNHRRMLSQSQLTGPCLILCSRLLNSSSLKVQLLPSFQVSPGCWHWLTGKWISLASVGCIHVVCLFCV